MIDEGRNSQRSYHAAEFGKGSIWEVPDVYQRGGQGEKDANTKCSCLEKRPSTKFVETIREERENPKGHRGRSW